MNKIDEYHKQCSRTYGPMPTGYQSGVLQGIECARSLATKELNEQRKITDALAERLRLTQQDLRGTKASIVHELELAGVVESYDGEPMGNGNYIQGIRILRDRAISCENK